MLRSTLTDVTLRLREELRRARYDGAVDLDALASGHPRGFLPLLHFALLGASLPVARWIAERGYMLSTATDERFVEAVHRLLRDDFSYRPQLTVQQLLSDRFAQKKVLLVIDVLRLCSAKHAALRPRPSSALRKASVAADSVREVPRHAAPIPLA